MLTILTNCVFMTMSDPPAWSKIVECVYSRTTNNTTNTQRLQATTTSAAGPILTKININLKLPLIRIDLNQD